jgi:hypothetical protein
MTTKLNIERLVIDYGGRQLDPARLRDALQRELAVAVRGDGQGRSTISKGGSADGGRSGAESIVARDLAIKIREAMKR